MTETRPTPERIDLTKADDLRDVVHRAVAALAQGALVRLVCSGEVGVAASACRDDALEALDRLSDALNDRSSPVTLLIRGAGEATDWVPDLPEVGRKLTSRLWPGPVTFVFPVVDTGKAGLLDRLPPRLASALRDGPSGVALQVPAEALMRDVLDLLPGPVVFRPLADGEGQGIETPGVGLILDPGPVTAVRPTVVRIDPTGWTLLAEGPIDGATLTRMAGTIILFVCTGNTCRSPMAEALCKARIAERLGCPIGELERRGFVVLSAGIAAAMGMPAASNAVAVVKARGGSLSNHQSRRLTRPLLLAADYVFGMTSDHVDAMTDHIPEVAARTRVLHPYGEDLDDPVGRDRETYARTADMIEESVKHLLDSLGL